MADTTYIDSVLKGAQLWGMGLERRLKEQQAASQEAERRVRERLLTEQAAVVHDKLSNEIQFRADMTKAALKAAQESSPMFEMPDAMGGIMQVPRDPKNIKTREDALMDNMGPVIASHRPEAVSSFMNAMAMSKFRGVGMDARNRGLNIQQQRADTYAQRVADQAAGGEEFSPEATTVIDPVTGKEMSMFRTGPKSFRFAPVDVGQRQKDQVANQSRLGIMKKLISDRPDLVTFDPEGNPQVTPEDFARYQKEGALTNANKTKAQESLSGALTSMQQIRQIEPLLNSSTIGPRAAVEDIVVDRALANVFPELVNKDRVKTSTLLSSLRATVIKSLRSDSNIAEGERKALESQVPGPAQFTTSPARAIEQLRTIQEGVLQRAIRASANLKQPLSDELVQFVSGNDVQEFLRNKIMTADQVRQWYSVHRKQ